MNMMTAVTSSPARLTPPIALLRSLPPGPLAKAYKREIRLAKMFAKLDRDDMEIGVELLLAELDARDGDPDFESAGDLADGSLSEDDFCEHNLAVRGPGCPVADGNCSTGSGAGDPSWAEWHTRGRFKVDSDGAEQCRTLGTPNMAREDDEDDDQDECLAADDRGGADAGPRLAMGDHREVAHLEEDAEADGGEQDGNCSEEDFMDHEWNGPGCPIADPDLSEGEI